MTIAFNPLWILGTFGGMCFAVSSVPMAWRCWKQRRTDLNQPFLMWAVWTGAVTMFAYICLALGFDWFVFLDYAITIVGWSVVIWFHYFPHRHAAQRCGDCFHFDQVAGEWCLLGDHFAEPDEWCDKWKPEDTL